MVKLGTGLVGTMAALVLGLLVASAATEFNAEATGLQTLATDFILLDRALKHYGPEASTARCEVDGLLEQTVNEATSRERTPVKTVSTGRLSIVASSMFDAIRDLTPRTDAQKTIQTQCMQICAELTRMRWTLIQGADNPIPIPFLAVLMFWLVALFLGFGLLAPRNGTVLTVLFVSAVSVAAAIFLIVDLNQPFDGLIRVSIDPIRESLAEVKR